MTEWMEISIVFQCLSWVVRGSSAVGKAVLSGGSCEACLGKGARGNI